jgi:hypothetical protein
MLSVNSVYRKVVKEALDFFHLLVIEINREKNAREEQMSLGSLNQSPNF